jgi:hypothetical protein
MARQKKASPPESGLMQCTQAYVTANYEAHAVGEVLPADHEAVLGTPQFWAALGTPKTEWGSPFDDAVAADEAEAEARAALARATRPPQLVRCERELFSPYVDWVNRGPTGIVSQGAIVVKVGEELRASDPLVQKHPDYFSKPYWPDAE